MVSILGNAVKFTEDFGTVTFETGYHPGEDGRSDGRTIPIIAMTPYDFFWDIKASFDAGMNVISQSRFK